MSEKKTDMHDGELVVLHDMVSFRDSEHVPIPGSPYALMYAKRGQKIGGEGVPLSSAEAKRLIDLGAASDDHGTLEAKLALSGQRPDTKLTSPYIALTSPAEQVRATQVVHRSGGPGPQSSKRELARLALADLKVMAVAYGYPDLAESDSKEEIISALKEGDEDSPSKEEIENQVQRRDEAQVSNREFGNEPGLVGTNVTAEGVDPASGEKTEPIESRRKSSADKAKDKSSDKK